MQNEFVCKKRNEALPIFLLSKTFCTAQASALSKDLIQIHLIEINAKQEDEIRLKTIDN